MHQPCVAEAGEEEEKEKEEAEAGEEEEETVEPLGEGAEGPGVAL
jgi:hypothetical protein